MNTDCYYVVRFVSRDNESHRVTGFLDQDNNHTQYFCAAWLFDSFREASELARRFNYDLPPNQVADVCKVPTPEFVHTVDYS